MKSVYHSLIDIFFNITDKTEKSPLLEALVSVLSAGPVAVGDKIGLSDPGLLAR